MPSRKFIYKCSLCNQKWKTKYIFDRHVLMCKLTLNSLKETENEIEELQGMPSLIDLYKIVQEMAIKQEKMQTTIDELSKYVQGKKKKINILDWLKKTYPDTETVNNWSENITVTDECLQTIFDNDIIQGVLNILIENKPPIYCFNTHANQFYAYEDSCWKILSNDGFDNILQIIIKLIYKKFSDWYENQKSIVDNKVQDDYCRYCKKLFNGKQDIKSQNRTIKSRYYKQTNISLKDIYEISF
jgi:hypothetical protein